MRKGITVDLVMQENTFGCGIACLAMVTGALYRTVAKFFTKDFATKGISLKGIDKYLEKQGCVVERKFAEGEDWIPKSFAPVHICEVKIKEESQNTHYVVMLKSGSILDPMSRKTKKLKDYHQVLNVAGIFPE